ncbi:hypothetical protein BKA70DRAFT_1243167 [Coprinopsis sp. MPI-PUGE-AT-0042]|nr:hypothetical protein BKA70DRAFT_1243167 [Coprinopsis sp. MPI-PUGE-AT-0042]
MVCVPKFDWNEPSSPGQDSDSTLARVTLAHIIPEPHTTSLSASLLWPFFLHLPNAPMCITSSPQAVLLSNLDHLNRVVSLEILVPKSSSPDLRNHHTSPRFQSLVVALFGNHHDDGSASQWGMINGERKLSSKASSVTDTPNRQEASGSLHEYIASQNAALIEDGLRRHRKGKSIRPREVQICTRSHIIEYFIPDSDLEDSDEEHGHPSHEPCQKKNRWERFTYIHQQGHSTRRHIREDADFSTEYTIPDPDLEDSDEENRHMRHEPRKEWSFQENAKRIRLAEGGGLKSRSSAEVNDNRDTAQEFDGV